MAKTALTPDQETQVRAWLRAGATIDQAHLRCCEQGWDVSRAKVGQLRQQVLREPAPGAAPQASPVTPETLLEAVQALQAQVLRLEQRMTALSELPTETLKQAAIGAVVQCRRLSQDPGVDPRVQVMALDKLPKLIELAMRISDEDEGGAGLFDPGAEKTT